MLQKQWEVSLQYAMFATPIGYLIDEQGILPATSPWESSRFWRWPSSRSVVDARSLALTS